VSIILHVATLLAVVVVFRKDVLNMVRHPFSSDSMKIYLATIPTCIIVLILMPLVSESFGGEFLAISFLISALLLICVEFLSKKRVKNEELSYRHAIIMGIAQGLAVFPGISRSGTTISAGLLSGANKKDCAKFSFLMSVPIILLSLVLEIIKIFVYHQTLSINILGIIIAFIVAFIVGIISIKLMIKLTEKANFKWFSLYLLFIAIVSFLV
jgi:undecaprenyl-diphosphatase